MADSPFQMREMSEVPREMRRGLTEHLRRVRHLVPPWCPMIRVYYEPTPPPDLAMSNCGVHIQVCYRHATLYVYPRWLDLDEERRHHSLVHEMSHFPTRALYDLANSIVKNLVSDSNTRSLLLEQIRATTEAATEDTAQMILRGETR